MPRTRMAGTIFAVSMLVGCSTTGPFGREKLALPVGPSYVGGRGMQMFPTSPTLLDNVKDAMSDVGIHSIVQNEDPSGLIILEGKTVDERKARVTILRSGANSTVSARVGWIGDEPLTRAMLDRIGSRHGTMPLPPSAIEKPKTEEENSLRSLLKRDGTYDPSLIRDRVDTGLNPPGFP